jgi:Tol biopolymer transport system component
MTEPIPDDNQQRRTWLIAGVLALVVVLVGVGVSFAVLANRAPSGKSAGYTPVEAATVTPVVATPTESVTPTASSSVTATGQSAATSSTTGGTIVRSGRIAYRKDSRIYIAEEDGSNPVAVFNSAGGSLSLSPDGKTLAVQQQGANSKSVVLVDVASGMQAQLSLAVDLPVWSADSSWVAYTSGSETGGYSIRRALRDGSGDEPILSGAAMPQIAPDGNRIAYAKRLMPSSSSTEPVRVYDRTTRKSTTVPNSGGAMYYAFATGGALYFVTGGTSGSVGVANKALSKGSIITSIGPGANVSPGPLKPSPDGSKILFALTGDDGYSRLRIVDVAAKKLISVDTNNIDARPVAWLLNGAGVLDIEGNPQQNEATSLCRRNTNGTGRKVVVQGADI